MRPPLDFAHANLAFAWRRYVTVNTGCFRRAAVTLVAVRKGCYDELQPDRNNPMKVTIRLSAREERKALPILLRHSAGTILPDRTYIISPEAAQALRDAGLKFAELCSEANPPSSKGVATGERI